MKIRKNLNKSQKILLLIGIVFLSVLIFNRATSRTTEMRSNCEKFAMENGCYLDDSEIDDFKAGRQLQEFARSSGFPSAKSVCGCASPKMFNITSL